MTDVGEQLVYMAFDVFLFIAAITVTVLLYKGVTKANYIVAKNQNNTTISEQDYATYDDYSEANSYKGYNLSSRVVLYDGDIPGTSVITDILETDSDIDIFVGTEKISDLMVGSEKFLDYARNTSINKLEAKIDKTKTYQRHIEKNDDGTVTAVKYVAY